MTLRSRSLPTLLRRTFAVAMLCLLATYADAPAQIRWNVVPRASLAWWQVSPHLNHLWATTCPEEPTWRPGEGRSSGWRMKGYRPPRLGYAGVADTVNVPLYPRNEARSICSRAVEGEVFTPDTVRWTGVTGEIVVRADALLTGSEDRDTFTRQAVLETSRYPEIRFTIDSVIAVSRQADTLRGTAVGLFSLRDVTTQMTADVQTWPEAGGLRVLAKFRIPATSLTTEYGLSRFALGLGIGARIWQDLFMGVDLVVRRDAPARDRF